MASANPPPLFGLPRELRDEIYFHLFNSTRLASGVRPVGEGDSRKLKRIRPARNSLAILRSCQQLKAEAQHAWLSRVTFVFENPKAFMEKLSSLSSEEIAQIRHIRVVGHNGHFRISDGTKTTSDYFLPPLFRLFPSLKLDVLTVLHCDTGVLCNNSVIDHFLKSGQGWRTLRFITMETEVDDWSVPDVDTKNFSQVDAWKAVLTERDGAQQDSSISIVQATETKPFGYIINPTYGKYVNVSDLPPIDKNGEALKPDFMHKNIIFTATRGADVDITQIPTWSRYYWEPRNDIIDFKKSRSWQRFLNLYEVCYLTLFGPVMGDQFDVYSHVDDFDWQCHPDDDQHDAILDFHSISDEEDDDEPEDNYSEQEDDANGEYASSEGADLDGNESDEEVSTPHTVA